MRALLSTVAIALLLAACGQETSAPPEPAASAERPQSAAVVGPILITFTETGAGEIDGDTPLNARSIGDVFPGSTVAQATHGEAGVEIVTVRRDDGLSLDLHPGQDRDRVGRIFGRGGPVTGPMGEEIGADWLTLGFAAEDCQRGLDDMSHTLICYRQGAPLLGYVFDLPDVAGPDDQAPDVESLERTARLTAFMWTAAAN